MGVLGWAAGQRRTQEKSNTETISKGEFLEVIFKGTPLGFRLFALFCPAATARNATRKNIDIRMCTCARLYIYVCVFVRVARLSFIII